MKVFYDTFAISPEDAESDDDYARLYEQAEQLFHARKVRLHRGYRDMLVLVDRGKVIAAAATAYDMHENSLEFSVATLPGRERQGLARILVQEVLALGKRAHHWRDEDAGPLVVRAEVINPKAMIPLLVSFGFQDVGRTVWEYQT